MPRARKEPLSLFVSRPHPRLYEINTWAWLEEISAKYNQRITLGSVPKPEWDAVAALGFDYVWLMGVWARSPASRKLARSEPSLIAAYETVLPGWTPEDVVGSPYAIRAYRPDPRLGSWTDLDHARAQLHARGLGLLLDFVPNHTALDHPWVRTHPDFYLQGTKGDYEREPAAFFMVRSARGGPRYLARGRDPFFPPWTDTAQLNHFHPPTRAALGREIQTIAAHCDGLRCDMAMLVLNDIFARTWDQQLRGCERPATEFWPEVTAAAPRLLWLAEAYWNLEWQLQQLGFHFTYDKRLYDRLRHAPREVYLHLKADWDYQKGLARFLENHDEPRAAVVFGRERFEAVATLVGTLPGMRFFHQGQLEGRRHHLPVQLARAGPEPPDPLIRSFYERLLPISHAEVFHRGEWCLLQRRPAGDSTFEGLIPYRWRSKSAYKLVVANLAGYTAQGIVPLEGEIEPGRDYDFYDQLNDVHYERGGEDLVRHGLFVRLEAHRAHLFDVRPR